MNSHEEVWWQWNLDEIISLKIKNCLQSKNFEFWESFSYFKILALCSQLLGFTLREKKIAYCWSICKEVLTLHSKEWQQQKVPVISLSSAFNCCIHRDNMKTPKVIHCVDLARAILRGFSPSNGNPIAHCYFFSGIQWTDFTLHN